MKNSDLVQAADLERETGLGKDLLRKWRARYGFPAPVRRDADGGGGGAGTSYPREQIRQLCLIKKLLDTGYRPVQVVGKTMAELERLACAMAEVTSDVMPAPAISAALELLRADQIDALEQMLGKELAQRGPGGFASETAAPLTQAIGAAWARGTLATYQEHRCSALLLRLLLSADNTAPPTSHASHAPRILFTTPPEELHILGLLMIQAVLRTGGACCIDMGAQTTIHDTDMAARAYGADIVCLSFSAAYPERRLRPFLTELRDRLPPSVLVWAGGAGVAGMKRPPPGVRLFSDLQRPLAALTELMTARLLAPAAGRRQQYADGTA